MTTIEALELTLNEEEFGPGYTIRDYFKDLLLTLWEKGEGFSGKRPFGNSGWKNDLYTPLINAGLVDGYFDEYGFIEDFDSEQANELVNDLICAL